MDIEGSTRSLHDDYPVIPARDMRDGRAAIPSLGDLRNALVFRKQQLSRWFGTTELELLYQGNYIELSRQTPWLTEVPLGSPQGGTANFSFLYLLLSVLRTQPVSRVLEFGVGKSSRLIGDFVSSSQDAE